ncbi:MAG: hypothetical protein CME06_11980 [Gemmatimonadetes bacterium]|nr:hypothetical protein [Gemmatimonadota bacterium]
MTVRDQLISRLSNAELDPYSGIDTAADLVRCLWSELIDPALVDGAVAPQSRPPPHRPFFPAHSALA